MPYVSNLERWGAPKRLIEALPFVLLGIVLANVGVITLAWLTRPQGPPKALLVTVWLIALAAVLLLTRLWRSLRRSSAVRDESRPTK
jgi:hypothetical protein